MQIENCMERCHKQIERSMIRERVIFQNQSHTLSMEDSVAEKSFIYIMIFITKII